MILIFKYNKELIILRVKIKKLDKSKLRPVRSLLSITFKFLCLSYKICSFPLTLWKLLSLLKTVTNTKFKWTQRLLFLRVVNISFVLFFLSPISFFLLWTSGAYKLIFTAPEFMTHYHFLSQPLFILLNILVCFVTSL